MEQSAAAAFASKAVLGDQCFGFGFDLKSKKDYARGYPKSRISIRLVPAIRSIPIKCSAVDEQVTLQASTMHETYDLLAQRLVKASSLKSDSKYLVGIAGPPGAGKSTLANEVVGRVNMLNKDKNPEIAIAVPMDGFHLYKHQLDAMEDPEEAHARRGAPWTFNPMGLVNCLRTLKSQEWAYFPSFDHGVGDPVEQDILVSDKHKIVLVEGNYLLLEDGDWRKLKSLFDERWFISLDLDTAMQRVELRHISTGKSKEQARRRVKLISYLRVVSVIPSLQVDYNDCPNAELILTTRGHSDLIINSMDHCK